MNTANLVRAARAAEAAGQVARSVQLCNQILFEQPHCVDALLILGSLAARQGRLKDALSFLKRAFDADSTCYDAARWLTTLLIGQNGGAEAVEFGHIAIRLRPNEAEAHVVLGLAAMGNGDTSLAIQSFERAIELNPAMSGAYHNLGVAYHREESFDEAIEAFGRAIKLSPNVAETYIHLGRSYLAKDMGDAALECAEKCLALNPKSTTARSLLSDATFTAVHGVNGERHIQKAIARDPNHGFPFALLGSRLQEQGKFQEAEESIKRSIELLPEQGFAYYLLTTNRKIVDTDRPTLLKIDELNRHPGLIAIERQYINFALGKAYDDLKDYEKAIYHFDLANGDSATGPASSKVARLDRHASRVHRFIQIFTDEFMDCFKSIGIESDRPIFIFGMPRSGTTLLEQILSRHSQVGAAGEQFFWRDSSRRTINLSSGILNTPELRKAGERYLELLASISPGKAHVTDKFPSNYVYLGLLNLIYPNAHFIHARRHPIDICLSIYMRPFVNMQEHGRTRVGIVESLRLYREAIQHWRKVLGPNGFIDVDYELLVQNQEDVSRKVVEYCGLEWEDACLSPQEGDRRVITFSKWQVRQPVYTTSVERWRNYEPWLGVFRELLDDVPPQQAVE